MAGLLGGGGGGGGLRGHGELPLNADINVTSLVDVAFVLLIIFMITAPIMQGGVDVRLPRAEARPLEPKTGLVVTVDQNGRIFLDQSPLSYEDFRATFGAVAVSGAAGRRAGAGAGGAPRSRGRAARGRAADAAGAHQAAAAQEHRVARRAAAGARCESPRARAPHDIPERAAPRGDAVHGQRSHDGEPGRDRVPLP